MSLRLLHITDTHLFAEPHARQRELDTEQSLQRVIAAASSEPWDLALVTGDLVHDGSAEGYRRLAGHLAVLGVPALCLPGNHDDPAVLRQSLPAGLTDWRRTHESASWTILMLNSHLPGAVGGELGDDERVFLDERLDAGTGPVLIALHHPPVAIGSPWMDNDGLRDEGAFWSIVDRHPRVRGVLWGHIHQAFDHSRGKVRLMASPSTGIQFTPGSRTFSIDQRPPGYRRLLLAGDGRIESEVVRVQEGQVQL